MKKILLSAVFAVSTMFASENTLISILNNVSIPDVNKTITNAKVLQKDINKENFTKLLESWKKVEALYFAGDINEDYIDTPRYIDVFHNLKENLSVQMQRAIDSKDAPRVALFKNSFRTINALEYVLFNDDLVTQREKLLAVEILNSMISNLEDIKEIYEGYIKSPDQSEKWENAMIINTLIASSYRLKEWRIGDASGFSTKYKNDPKNKRAEYFLSKNSFNAIKAILEAHNEVIGNQKYYNFASMSKEAGAKSQIKEAQDAIAKTFVEIKKLKNDDFSNGKALFLSAKAIHNAYYLSLVEELSVTAKILDADGD